MIKKSADLLQSALFITLSGVNYLIVYTVFQPSLTVNATVRFFPA